MVNFDYAGWQERMGFNSAQAAAALDVSVSMYCKLRKDGKSRKLYAWAAYGVECAELASHNEATA